MRLTWYIMALMETQAKVEIEVTRFREYQRNDHRPAELPQPRWRANRVQNEALRRFLAASLKVPLSAVRIAAGVRSRTKRVEVRGVTAGAVRALAG